MIIRGRKKLKVRVTETKYKELRDSVERIRRSTENLGGVFNPFSTQNKPANLQVVHFNNSIEDNRPRL